MRHSSGNSVAKFSKSSSMVLKSGPVSSSSTYIRFIKSSSDFECLFGQIKKIVINVPSPTPAIEDLGFLETVNLDCLSWDSRSSIMSIML